MKPGLLDRFGVLVRISRTAQELSVDYCAAESGISPSSWTKIEKGGNPTLRTVSKIAAALGTTARALVAEAEGE